MDPGHPQVHLCSALGQTTHLKFDDFISDPITLDNCTTQVDPSSMTSYGFYNAPLIETAMATNELSTGFINNSIMLVIGDTLEQCHAKLKDMMERPNRRLDWSVSHNSPFELTALMNFPRSFKAPILGPLSLSKPNWDGTTTIILTHTVASYKYLWVIFGPKLKRMLHHKRCRPWHPFGPCVSGVSQSLLVSYQHMAQINCMLP